MRSKLEEEHEALVGQEVEKTEIIEELKKRLRFVNLKLEAMTVGQK